MTTFKLMGKNYTTALEQAEADKRIYGLANILIEFEYPGTEALKVITGKARKAMNKTKDFDGKMHLTEVHKFYFEKVTERKYKAGTMDEETFKSMMYVANL
jgi:hypothetical protein